MAASQEARCLRKAAKCLEWIAACHQGSEHTEHIAKRDVHVSNVSQLAVQDMSSTYPIPSLKQEVHAVTLTISGSAAVGLLLGMATMFFILWQCKRRNEWKASNNVIRSQENPSYDENVVLMNNEPDRNAPRHLGNFSTLEKQVSGDTSNENRAHSKEYSDPMTEGSAYEALG
uniref:Uncharacterized protein n=1 Tax=Magallana gigas TaxID=29159 RepID=A0A8W8LTR9_MAGGI|nr:uncharacterized protein LOC105335052 [Crassostrea gigas]